MSQIDIKLFSPNPWNFNRSDESEKQELAESIRAEGVTIPILVRPKGDGYEIIDGEQKITVCHNILNMTTVPESWVTVRNMSDDEARNYIRTSLTRSKNKDLMKEAYHYFEDKREKGMDTVEYAESVGKNIAEMYRILNRINTPQSVQTFISNTTLPASVVDEVLKAKPQFALEYLKEAEDKQWNTTNTRERMNTDRTENGDSVIDKPKTKPYEEELNRMSMEERGAVSKVLETIVINYAKLSKYLSQSGYSELSNYVYGDSVKNATKMKNLFDGVHNVIPKDRSTPIYRVNLVRDYVKKGNMRQNVLKIDDLVKKINRTPP